jgi:ribbon-helix-helix CopG family protein
MIRTQIQLPEKEYRELQKTAVRQNKSMAHCIRVAIRMFLNHSAAEHDDLESIAGKFRPLPLTDLKDHDRWISEAIIESKIDPESR